MFIVTSYPGTFFPRTFGDGVWTRLSLIPEPVHVAPDSENPQRGFHPVKLATHFELQQKQIQTPEICNIKENNGRG